MMLARVGARVAIGLALGATAFAQEPLVVGSKAFSESWILGDMLSLLLEKQTDLAVEHRRNLGGTLICFAALESGEVDVYPEYTGTGWSVVLGEEREVTDSLEAFLSVQTRFRERHDIEWLQPFGFDNTYALAMQEARAEELGVRTIGDLLRHAPDLRAGFSVEFLNREDGFAGLAPAYGLEFGDVKGMEHGLAYEALASGVVDVVDAYSTDGKLLRYGLRVLADDRSFFPPYHAAPVIRGETLRRHPELERILGGLAFRLDADQMAKLNYAVEVEGRESQDVAREFLTTAGLLQASSERSDTRRERDGFVSFFMGRWGETRRLLWQHLLLTLQSVLAATLIAVPLGIAITHSRWAERLSLGVTGAIQTIPSLALLVFMIAIPGLGLRPISAVVALTLYALLPILRNTFAGLRSVDPELIDAARGIGLTERDVLLRVQLPMAVGTIMAGVRTAAVVTVGFATLAAFIGAGGLGEPILTGLYLNDKQLILAGALPAALLALATDWVLGRLELLLTPRPLRNRSS